MYVGSAGIAVTEGVNVVRIVTGMVRVAVPKMVLTSPCVLFD